LGIRVRVQGWWRAQHGVHTTPNAQENKKCHKNIIITNSAMDETRSG
jgi:hypothetical protein